jgi:cobalt-zinc-cadmium efflux system protein
MSHAGCDHSGHHASQALLRTLLLTLVYMAAEAIGGWYSGSLALLADAGHMLSDAAALGISVVAAQIARWPATRQHTYGFHRAEVLAALANAVGLIAVTGWIFYEAAQRLQTPEPIDARVMIPIACGGLIVNLLGLKFLHGGKEHNLNIRGAWLHVFFDMLGSVAALAAAAGVFGFGWNWADPVASVLIGVFILISSWSLIRAAVRILMQGVPEHLELTEIEAAVRQLPGVVDLHDLHVWSITSGKSAASLHLVSTRGDERELLAKVRTLLDEQFGLRDVTIQIEHADDDCPQRE